jgi:ADP-heptose:LPS heptosyltransferase
MAAACKGRPIIVHLWKIKPLLPFNATGAGKSPSRMSYARFEQKAKHVILRAVEGIASRTPIDPATFDFRSIRSVLVIRQHDMYGDFLLATPVFRALRQSFPGVRIGAVVRETFAELLSNNPDIDRIVTVPRDRSRWSLDAFSELWSGLREGWDAVAVLTTVSHSLTSDVLGLIAGPKIMLGSDSPVLPGAQKNFLYTTLVPLAPGLRHQTDRNLDVVRAMGADTEDLRESVVVTDAERTGAMERFRRAGAVGGKPIIGIHPGAGKPGNRWPAERFAELAGRVAARGAQVALLWGPAELDLRDRFLETFGSGALLIPPGSLRDLAANLAGCSFVLCNDTGVLHLAASVGTPLVVMFGPTPSAEWKPIGDHVTAVQSPSGDIGDIGVDLAWQVVESRLAQRGL